MRSSFYKLVLPSGLLALAAPAHAITLDWDVLSWAPGSLNNPYHNDETAWSATFPGLATAGFVLRPRAKLRK